MHTAVTNLVNTFIIKYNTGADLYKLSRQVNFANGTNKILQFIFEDPLYHIKNFACVLCRMIFCMFTQERLHQ